MWALLKDLVHRLTPKTIPGKFYEIHVEMCQMFYRSVADRIHHCIEYEGGILNVLNSLLFTLF